jgi:hypothetical protein
MLTRTVFDVERCDRVDVEDDELFAAMFDAVTLLGGAVLRQFSTGLEPWRTCVLLMEAKESLLVVNTWKPNRFATVGMLIRDAVVAPKISITPILDVLGSDLVRQVAHGDALTPRRPLVHRLGSRSLTEPRYAPDRLPHRYR